MSCPKGAGKPGSKIRTWTHTNAAGLKPGDSWRCPKCGKVIRRKIQPTGHKYATGAFGKPNWMRDV